MDLANPGHRRCFPEEAVILWSAPRPRSLPHAREIVMLEVLAWIPFAAIILLCIALMWLSTLLKRTAGLTAIEAKLDLLLRKANLSFDPFENLSPAVTQALQRGDKLAAIKAYRMVSGAGLAQAKEFIEEAQRRLPPSP